MSSMYGSEEWPSNMPLAIRTRGHAAAPPHIYTFLTKRRQIGQILQSLGDQRQCALGVVLRVSCAWA